MTRQSDLEAQATRAVAAQLAAADLRTAGRMPYLADDIDCPDYMRLAALGEEFGEACKALHDGDPEQLATELSQLAGICLAWGIVL